MRKITIAACALALGFVWAVAPATAQDTTKSKDESVKGKMERAKDTTKEKVSGAVETTKEKTSEAVEKTKEKAAEVKEKVRDKVTGGRGSDDIRAAQQALKDKGFDPGPIDGRMGPRTKAAVSEYQGKENLKATGRLDRETKAHLTGTAATSGRADTTTPPAASPATGPESKTQKQQKQ